MTNDKHEHYSACEQQAHEDGLEATTELYASLKVLAMNGSLDPIAAIEHIADAIETLERRLKAAES